ncbi:Hypothetical predicted protein [Marmota monax]|uniref:G-protein coupled receptors family 1 profile domain-containing protein n=1 Tax=Marmota monax TaxID=9995 RepID=A0A5E4BJF2_MARMO|nr:Hypothetical predicted protein [Marmota monax]
MHLTTVLGNLLIILLIRLDSRLHTLMYFFLMMAYDRYVAICHPLHYAIIMRKEPCVLLAAGSWFFSCVHALLHTLLLSHLSFCADNTIPHYFSKENLKNMRRDNQSSVSEISPNGLPIQPEQQGMYYALFLGMYLTMVLGNLLTILLIRLDSRLHTPMYFFLSHLALTDISFSSVTAPKMLMNMLTQTQSISYAGCLSQAFFFLLFGGLDSFLLTSMAYDRYVAICHPLHYTTIISQSLCFLLVLVSWVLSSAGALVHTLLLARLSFLRGNTLPHFFCDLSALVKLSSSDTTINQLVILTVGLAIVTLPFICILVSYGHIGASVLRRPSTKGICKALSTCGSHLSVVSLYYGAIIALYFVPSSNNSSDEDVIVSVFYTLVTPMLNPFIYTLRNRDIKGALRIILSRGALSA